MIKLYDHCYFHRKHYRLLWCYYLLLYTTLLLCSNRLFNFLMLVSISVLVVEKPNSICDR